MWKQIVLLVLLVGLGFIAIEDFRTRTIRVSTLLVCVSAAVLYSLSQQSFGQWGAIFLGNVAFIVVQLFFMSIYFSLRAKRWLNIVDHYIGLGDILFFVVPCILFHFQWFVIYYLLSLIVVLVGALWIQKRNKQQQLQVPLAGGQAICLIVFLVGDFFFSFHFHQNPLVLWLPQ